MPDIGVGPLIRGVGANMERINNFCAFLEECERQLKCMPTSQIHDFISGIPNGDQAYLAIIMADDLCNIFEEYQIETRSLLRQCKMLTNLQEEQRVYMVREGFTRSGRLIRRPREVNMFFYRPINERKCTNFDPFRTKHTLLDMADSFWNYINNWPRVEVDPELHKYSTLMTEAENEISSWNQPVNNEEAANQTRRLKTGAPRNIIRCIRWLLELRKPVYELEAEHMKLQLKVAFPMTQFDIVIPTGDPEAFEELTNIFTNYYRNQN